MARRSRFQARINEIGNTWWQERQVRLTSQRILADHLRIDWYEGQPAPGPVGPEFWPDMRLDLTGATLIDLNFLRVRAADARFAGATFTGTAQFYEVTFGYSSFQAATFTQEAAFSRASFNGRADFSKATFAGKSWFSHNARDLRRYGRDLGFRSCFGREGGLLVGVWVSNPALYPEPCVTSYLSRTVPATPGPVVPVVPAEPARGVSMPWVIAVGAGDAADPSGGREDGALVVAGGRRVLSGDVMSFAVPLVTVPVKVRRSGAVQADGWLPGQVRLGLLETMLGEGVIEELCDAAVAACLATPAQRKRLMSLPFTMRIVLAMTLMPDADYPEVIRAVTGLLPRLPWSRRWQVPTCKVVTKWRRRLGTWPLEQLFWRAAGPLVADGAPGSVMIAGRPLCAMDGFEVALPATPENLKVFSCTGVPKDAEPGKEKNVKGKKDGKGKNSAKAVKKDGKGKEEPAQGSFPHLRCLLVTFFAGRAVLGAAADTTDLGEQSLVARLVRERPELFAGRVFLMDRNFLGYEVITAILDAGGHLIMRVRDGISLPLISGGWLPDGSRMTYLNE